MFIAVAFYSIFFGIKKGIISAGILGFLQDVVSGNIFGFYLYLYIIFSLLIYISLSRLHKNAFLNQIFIVFIWFSFLKITHILFALIFKDAGSFNMIPYGNFLLNITCTSLFAPIFFYIFKKIHCYER